GRRKPGRRYLNRADFERFEERSETRHEWVCGIGLYDEDGEELGEVRPVQGYDDQGNPGVATYEHGELITNLILLLGKLLDRSAFSITNQCVEVRVPNGRTRYPDLIVASNPPAFEPRVDGERRVMTNPVVLIEVLSRTTTDTDLNDKLIEYLAIPSVMDYVVIDQTEPRAIHYRRVDAGDQTRWELETRRDGETVELTGCEAALPLADVYAGVFADPDGTAPAPPAG
ncbi:Uma2 family endonuclease, partial [Alienimonas sp. DA493]|uniref:Uma2 family endonuclease n=1 Tax=Alienimonas sp. DA493 TaxID=3373605 RepID=UPI0037553E74